MNSRKMDVPDPVYQWLATLKAAMTANKGRTVTYPEVWEHVKAVYESAREEVAP